jgi:hypothetical protein
MRLIYLIIKEIKKDTWTFYLKFSEIYIIINNYTWIKKFGLFLLWLSTILPIVLLFYLFFYVLKYFFKYFFLINDYYFTNILLIKYYNILFVNEIYFFWYLSFRYFILLIINNLPLLIKKIFKLIINWFYIKYYIKYYIIKFKKKIDKILYNIFLKIEYFFSFAYIEKIKFELDYKYIPKYKKYKKYSIQYWLIIWEKTLKIRKKIYKYIIYLDFLKRKIFWLYIKEIYLDLVWTLLKSWLYYIFILMPLYFYINMKYKIIKKYIQFDLNKRELIKPLKIIYFNILINFFKQNLYNLFLFFLIIVSIPFYFICKFLNYFLFSFIIYYIKVKLYNWYYFYKILNYEELKIKSDIEFQIYTLFFFVYMHAFHDLRLHWFILYILYKGYNKYYYFNKFYYKLYLHMYYKFIKNY